MKHLLLSYLKYLAHHRVVASRPKVVGVTGSVGKSSFVYVLDGIMKSDRPTKTTLKGNSESGLPLEILGLRDELDRFPQAWMSWASIVLQAPVRSFVQPLKAQLLIAEMGIDSTRPPQNMEYLLEIVQPDVGVFLSVAPAHTQQFAEELGLSATDSDAILQAIAREKGKIVTTLPMSGTAVVNIDSPYIRSLLPQIQAKIITFAADQAADYRVGGYSVSLEGTSFTFTHQKKAFTVTLPGFALSEEYGSTLGAVFATAHVLGVAPDVIVQKMQSSFRLPHGRMSLFAGKKASFILDSSYNSSPVALRSVLETAAKIKVFGKKILVLGDMRELGPLEAEAHRDIADLIAKTGDEIVLVGPKMREYVLPLLEKKKVSVKSVLSSKGLGEEMIRTGMVRKGDLIVVKGSQNTIFLEQTVKELLKDASDVGSVTRQEAQWTPIRAKFWESQAPVQL